MDEQNTVPAELERLAQAFEARDYKWAGVTIEKLVGHFHVPHPNPDELASPTAYSQSGADEMLKTARAITDENWSLAALCLGKAITAARSAPLPAGVTLENPDSALVTEQELLRAVQGGDHSTAASCIRRLTASFGFSASGA